MSTADNKSILDAKFYSIVNLSLDKEEQETELGVSLKSNELSLRYAEICTEFELYLRKNKKQRSIALEISLNSADLKNNLKAFQDLYSRNPDLEMIFASLYDENTLKLAEEIIYSLRENLDSKSSERNKCITVPLKSRIYACTPLTNPFILDYLKKQKKNSYPYLHLIPAVYSLKDLEYLKAFLNDLDAIKIFPCLAQNSSEIIESLSHPIKEIAKFKHHFLEKNFSLLENLEFHRGTYDLVTLIGEMTDSVSAKILNHAKVYSNPSLLLTSKRISDIQSIIQTAFSINPNLKIICAGFGKISLNDIKTFKENLVRALRPEFIDKIAIATRNNNFNEIEKFF